jgi:hypothetical protein
MKELTHDQLHVECHKWLWNTKPELRGLSHTNFSDIKIVEKVLRATTRMSIGNEARRVILSQLKSIGLVKGTYDYEFMYNGIIHFIEIKVGTDHLSDEQLQIKTIGESHGAMFHEVRSLDEFINLIEGILK